MAGDAVRVCIDARLRRGEAGGVEQGVIGLVSGLRVLEGEERYFLLTLPGRDEWIAPYAEGFAERIPARTGEETVRAQRLRQVVSRHAPGLRRVWRRVARRSPSAAEAVPFSDGVAESLGASVMHFTFQSGFRTDLPSIYQPWDLQYVHLPQFFTPGERALRESTYAQMCEQAAIVVVASEWARRDVISHFGLPESKVHVIPVGPLVELFTRPDDDTLTRVQARYHLPRAFAFYPAQTFPHKNHIALLEALALVRDRDGIQIPLVCAGRRNNHYPVIERRLRRLGLGDAVQFLGYVDPSEMPALYRLASCLVFPSKFEGWGMPIHEAFDAGTPVACSTATSLPEVAGDAALLFDPDNTDDIAAAVLRIWQDDVLQTQLVEAGHRRVREFSLERTAREFRARYRLLAGAQLDPEDTRLLGAHGAVTF
jgi:glycosyltransferase involved in cell wall biosynthesis